MNQAAECLGYAVNDVAGTITEISTAYANALGYHVGELIGRNFREIIAPESCSRAEECFTAVLRQGPGCLPATYALPDGGRISMALSVMPVRAEDGRLSSVLIIPQAGSMSSPSLTRQTRLIGRRSVWIRAGRPIVTGTC